MTCKKSVAISDGKPSRDFTHVEKAVDANRCARETEGHRQGWYPISAPGRLKLTLKLARESQTAPVVRLFHFP